MAFVSEEQVVKALRQYNPWWRTPAAVREACKPVKRLAFYEALRAIRHGSIRRFVVLSGARRVGKTTIMRQMMARLIDEGVPPRNILYVSFDNPMLKLVDVETILSIYETLHPLEGERYVFFDEIQYTERWELWMKVVYDRRPDIRLTATGSASPVLERGAADSGTGRWSVLKAPTLSFYEYCLLLGLDRPLPSRGLRLADLAGMDRAALGDLTDQFAPLVNHFNRYLTVGGFPELALADDDAYAQRMLREDVVDKVIKRDVPSLFNIRNPLLMEKLFLYLCMHSTGIFSAATVAKELQNISVNTIESYLGALETANLIHLAPPLAVGGKGSLKGKPKIFIADPAIRNAVLMIDDMLADEKELGMTVETCVYKHILSFYQGGAARIGYYRKARDNRKEVDVVALLPREKILWEVKYRNNAQLSATDAIVELCRDEGAGVTGAFLVTRRLDDVGLTGHEAGTPILRLPALVLLYLLGRMEAERVDGDG